MGSSFGFGNIRDDTTGHRPAGYNIPRTILITPEMQNRAFVFLRHSLAVKPAEIFPLTRSRIFFAGTQAMPADFQRFGYPSFGTAFTSHLAGKVNRNFEPRPSLLSTLTLPPWASTKVLTIARPSPRLAV